MSGAAEQHVPTHRQPASGIGNRAVGCRLGDEFGRGRRRLRCGTKGSCNPPFICQCQQFSGPTPFAARYYDPPFDPPPFPKLRSATRKRCRLIAAPSRRVIASAKVGNMALSGPAASGRVGAGPPDRVRARRWSGAFEVTTLCRLLAPPRVVAIRGNLRACSPCPTLYSDEQFPLTIIHRPQPIPHARATHARARQLNAAAARFSPWCPRRTARTIARRITSVGVVLSPSAARRHHMSAGYRGTGPAIGACDAARPFPSLPVPLASSPFQSPRYICIYPQRHVTP